MSDVSRETSDRLKRFADLLRDENGRQNLVAASTLASLWDRHLVDGLQLLDHAPSARHWLDIGSGPGLPGIVLAIAAPTTRFTLVEPRGLRVAFLHTVVRELALTNVEIHQAKIATVPPVGADAITARAVASLPTLFTMGFPHAAPECTWVLPKGRSAPAELVEARQSWQGDFSLVESRTDPAGSIVIARNVQPRKSPRRAR